MYLHVKMFCFLFYSYFRPSLFCSFSITDQDSKQLILRLYVVNFYRLLQDTAHRPIRAVCYVKAWQQLTRCEGQM